MRGEKIRQQLKDQIEALDKVQETLKELMNSTDSQDWEDRFEAARVELVRIVQLTDPEEGAEDVGSGEGDSDPPQT